MENAFHRFGDLFAQLGLPADNAGIREFIAAHTPLAGEIRLADAPFWSAVQARLLRELIAEDADWAEVVDHLDAALRLDP